MTKWLPDLRRAEGAIYLEIATAITTAVESGELPAGTKLPTHRDLAYRLGVSIQTVSAGYREAERRGLVVGETGRGTFVRNAPKPATSQFIVDRRDDDLIDLSISRPVSGAIHEDAIRRTLAQASEDLELAVMLSCRPIAGLDRHRAAASHWLGRHGVEAPPGQVVICNGAAHGLLLALATLTDPGDTVATDVLTDHGFILLANSLHVRLRPLASDDQGITPKSFEAACRTANIKALFTVPTFNNPDLSVMSAERRQALAGIARRHGVAIIEDDPYAPLCENRPPTLRSFAPERTFYVTTFTKCLLPGLRTGYLVAPSHAIPRILSRLRATTWMATPLVAEIAARWIGDGTAERLIAWQRQELVARQKSLESELRGTGLVYRRNALHAWLPVPEEWRVEAFAASLRQRNVAVTPAEVFVVGREMEPHFVRVSLGAARTRAQFEHGLRIVAEMLARNPEPILVET